MAKNSARSATPAQLLSLLWNPPQASGRSGLTVSAITDAGIAIADAEGLEAVTMRRIADTLGSGTMSLYGYIPGRGELIELMTDRVAGGVYEGKELPAAQRNWQDGLRYIADRNFAHQTRHAWTAQVPPGRPVLGPGVCGKYEAELAPLDGIGLSDVQMDLALTSLLGLTEAAARWHIGLERVRQASGQDDARWWAEMGPMLAQEMQGRDFPLSGRVGTSAGQEHQAVAAPVAQLKFGVAQLIGGIERLCG